MAKTIFYSLAALDLPLENKIHIFAPPCNILWKLVVCVLVLFAGFVIQFCFFLVKFCVSGLVFFCVCVFLFWDSTCFCFGFWVCDDTMYENFRDLVAFPFSYRIE